MSGDLADLLVKVMGCVAKVGVAVRWGVRRGLPKAVRGHVAGVSVICQCYRRLPQLCGI